jgi:ABC-2 type transport system permease protein
MTILRKEVRRFLRIWPQTLLPSAITMSLYFVIFGSLIGSRIGDMGGFSYMEFVVPGIDHDGDRDQFLQQCGVVVFWLQVQSQVEELLVSPTPNYVILMGYVVGGVTRGLLVAMIVTARFPVLYPMQIHSLVWW